MTNTQSIAFIALALITFMTTSGCIAESSADNVDQPDSGPLPAIALVDEFPNVTLTRPVRVEFPKHDKGHVWVVLQAGKIVRFPNKRSATGDDVKTILDLTNVVPKRRHNEEGLLDMALHPKFQENGFVFAVYTRHDPRRNVLAGFMWDSDKQIIKRDSESVILEIKQPAGNHNGGCIRFGPDGFLYYGLGDGGRQRDPQGHGQNLATFLGTILRIDIDKPTDDRKYSIPDDNPFIDHKTAKPEIWAYGLRNPWRFAFDSKTDDCICADVGQNAWEEVDVITKGGNYGWNAREGKHRHSTGTTKDMIDPIAEYDHKHGLSITGGTVYRGSKYPTLRGVYVYCDYISGRFWGLKYDAKTKKVQGPELMLHTTRRNISSFNTDASGELFAVDHAQGRILRVTVKK